VIGEVLTHITRVHEAAMRNARAVAIRSVVYLFALVTLLAAPRLASAQISVGGFLGAEFDNQDNWLLFGAEGRFSLRKAMNGPWDFNPRLSYHSYGGGASATQIDLNLLYDLELAHPGRFAPYVGIGGTLVTFKAGDLSESHTGLNLITGVKLVTKDSGIEPFMNTQYSIIPSYPNSYTLVFGALFRIGGR
jgi:hypothetical protein